MSLTKVTYSMIDGPFINPKDYGVIGNGVDDDSIAMQAALTAAVTTQSPLVLSTTTYNISDAVLSATLSAGEKLVIIGNGAVFNTTIADAAEYYDGFFTINGTDTSEVIISDFSIASNQSGAWSSTRLRGKMVGLAIKTMTNVSMTNVSVSGFAFINIWLYYLNKGLVINCQAENASYAGISMQSCLDINVIGGIYNQNGGNNSGTKEGYGITIATRHQVADRDNARIKIDGITAIDNIGKGIDAHDCEQFTVTNNHIRGFGLNGIYAVNEGGSKIVSDVIISGNYISGSGGTSLANSCIGIQVGSTVDGTIGGIVVTNNIIRNVQNSASNNFGVFVNNPSEGTLFGRIIIENNSFEDAGGNAGSVGAVIRFDNGDIPWPEVCISNNTIQQSVAVYGGIIVVPADSVAISSNVIKTTSTMIFGMVVGSTGKCTFTGNILDGTFTNKAINIYGVANQIARGNIVNNAPMADFMNTGATVDFGTAIPTTGEGYFYQGSIRWNKNATSGQPAGWMCTVAGTTSGSPASTWKAMANLA